MALRTAPTSRPRLFFLLRLSLLGRYLCLLPWMTMGLITHGFLLLLRHNLRPPYIAQAMANIQLQHHHMSLLGLQSLPLLA